MSDLADSADAIINVQHEVSLYQSRRFVPIGTATGFCWQCGESVSDGMRWCDADCRDDWERDNK